MIKDWILKEVDEYYFSFCSKGFDSAQKVLSNIKKATDDEQARDHLAVFRVGHLFVEQNCKIFFEERRIAKNPHDIVIAFNKEELFIEVKRLQRNKQGGCEFEKKLLESTTPVERPAVALGTLIRAIRTCNQFEPDKTNILWFVSDNNLFWYNDMKDARWFETTGCKLLPEYDVSYQKKKDLTAVAWSHDHLDTTAKAKVFFLSEGQHVKELLKDAAIEYS